MGFQQVSIGIFHWGLWERKRQRVNRWSKLWGLRNPDALVEEIYAFLGLYYLYILSIVLQKKLGSCHLYIYIYIVLNLSSHLYTPLRTSRKGAWSTSPENGSRLVHLKPSPRSLKIRKIIWSKPSMTFPNTQCMVYLPTFTIQINHSCR